MCTCSHIHVRVHYFCCGIVYRIHGNRLLDEVSPLAHTVCIVFLTYSQRLECDQLRTANTKLTEELAQVKEKYTSQLKDGVRIKTEVGSGWEDTKVYVAALQSNIIYNTQKTVFITLMTFKFIFLAFV